MLDELDGVFFSSFFELQYPARNTFPLRINVLKCFGQIDFGEKKAFLLSLSIGKSIWREQFSNFKTKTVIYSSVLESCFRNYNKQQDAQVMLHDGPVV